MAQNRVSSRSKIVSLEELARIADDNRSRGRKTVLCHGVFDLLHPGHVRHFEEARKLGDVLMVTVTQDRYVNKGPGRPAFNESLRAETLASLSLVDFVAVSPAPTAVEVIRSVKPDFYAKGQDYEDRQQDVTRGILEEEEAVRENGGQIHFTHDVSFSSSSLLNNHFGVYPERARDFLKEFRSRFSAEQVIAELNGVRNLKVLVIGDSIVDEYHYCEPLGKSPKETIVSTRYQSEESFPGGVLACANHIAAFSDHVTLATCLGAKDSKREFIDSHLNPSIDRKFFFRDDACTIVKRRYVEPAFLTKMFQITFMTDTDLPTSVSENLSQYLSETLPTQDVVVVADYGHGFLDSESRKLLCSKSRFLALNVQTNSANLGYNLVTKYERASYICIDEPELRLAMQQRYAPIRELIEGFAERYPGTVITITRGHKGSVTAAFNLATQRLDFVEAPSVSQAIVDRVGAGDAYFAISSLLAAHHAPIEILGLSGNAAGALAVGIVCNRSSIEAVPLIKFMRSLLA